MFIQNNRAGKSTSSLITEGAPLQNSEPIYIQNNRPGTSTGSLSTPAGAAFQNLVPLFMQNNRPGTSIAGRAVQNSIMESINDEIGFEEVPILKLEEQLNGYFQRMENNLTEIVKKTVKAEFSKVATLIGEMMKGTPVQRQPSTIAVTDEFEFTKAVTSEEVDKLEADLADVDMRSKFVSLFLFSTYDLHIFIPFSNFVFRSPIAFQYLNLQLQRQTQTKQQQLL
jgi:hypothetical protein